VLMLGIAVAALICFAAFREDILDGGSAATDHLASSTVFGFHLLEALFGGFELLFEAVELIFLAVYLIFPSRRCVSLGLSEYGALYRAYFLVKDNSRAPTPSNLNISSRLAEKLRASVLGQPS
jgi:hypothetical protein